MTKNIIRVALSTLGVMIMTGRLTVAEPINDPVAPPVPSTAVININSWPSQVIEGRSASIRVTWAGVDISTYNLGIIISNSPAPEGQQPITIEKTFNLPLESGSETFAFPIPDNILGNSSTGVICYIDIFVNDKILGKVAGTPEVRTPNDVIAVTPNVPSRNVYYGHAVVPNGEIIIVSYDPDHDPSIRPGAIDLGLGWIAYNSSNLPRFFRDESLSYRGVYYGNHNFNEEIVGGTPGLSYEYLSVSGARSVFLGYGWIEQLQGGDVAFVRDAVCGSSAQTVYHGWHDFVDVYGWSQRDTLTYDNITGFPNSVTIDQGWIESVQDANGVTFLADPFNFILDQAQPSRPVYEGPHYFITGMFPNTYSHFSGEVDFPSTKSDGWVLYHGGGVSSFIVDLDKSSQDVYLGLHGNSVIESLLLSEVTVGGRQDWLFLGKGWIGPAMVLPFGFIPDLNYPPSQVYAEDGHFGFYDPRTFLTIVPPPSGGFQNFQLDPNARELGTGWIMDNYMPDGFLSEDQTALFINSYPLRVTAGTDAKINVSWNIVNNSARDLFLKVSNYDPVRSYLPGQSPIWVEKSFSLPSGRGTQTFSLPIPSYTSSGECYVLAFIGDNTQGQGWANRLILVRTPDNVVSVIAPATLSLSSYPSEVIAGNNVDIKVAWSGVDTGVYNLDLKVSNSPSGPISVENKFELPSCRGEQVFTLSIPKNTPSGNCYIYAFIGRRTQGLEGRLTNVVTADDAIAILPPPPPLAIISYPSQVVAGNNAPISVTWDGVDTTVYNLGLQISNQPTGFVSVGQLFELSSGSGTQTFNLAVPSNTPEGSCYVYAFINHKTLGWNSRWAEARTADNVVTILPPPDRILATASSVEQNNPLYGADKAVDGYLSSRWSSAFSEPQWIYMDLRQQRQINKVTLWWETAYGKSYKIQVSNDAVNWTDVYYTNNSNGGIDEIYFAAVTVRYVRMYGIQRATQWGYSLCIFEATYQDVPVGATASASSAENSNFSAGKAIDNNSSTRWSSQFSDPQWICIDFKTPKTFSVVTFNWETAYAKSYKIQVSDDFLTWRDVFSTTTGYGDVERIYVGTQTARYVRMYGTKRATQWGYSLWEFKVN